MYGLRVILRSTDIPCKYLQASFPRLARPKDKGRRPRIGTCAMSTTPTTPRHQAVPTHEIHDQDDMDMGGQAASVQEHSSLFHEIHETVRRLLQHIIFACLLSLRLYMLPLLYLSHKLTVRDDPWYFATWNMMLRPGRSMANCAQCHGEGGGSSIIQRWRTLKDNFSAPVRILRTLYALGQAIGEDPNTLQPMPPPLLVSGPDSAIDVRSVQENTPKPLSSEATESTTEAPASASQIYHAALLNGSTLDNILAAFETDTPASPNQFEHVIREQSPISNRDHDERLTGPFKRHRYRVSSVRSKTQETPIAQALDSSPIFSAEACQIVHHLPKTPYQNFCESQEDVLMESPCSHEAAQCQTPIVSSPHEHDHCKEQIEHQETTSPEVRHCPTFIRRHNHSSICKRPLSGERTSLTVLQERGTMSSPGLSTSSPTKRARLQRRVRVYKEEDRV